MASVPGLGLGVTMCLTSSRGPLVPDSCLGRTDAVAAPELTQRDADR
jgi:hypothetical protein